MSEKLPPIIKFDCLPCTIFTALKFIRLSTESESERLRVFKKVLSLVLRDFDKYDVPAKLANVIFNLIKSETGVDDPLKDKRREINERSLTIMRRIRNHVRSAKDSNSRLKRAITAALIGNLIDFGIADHRFDLNELYRIYIENLEKGFAINDLNQLLKFLNSSKRVVIIGDNVGEIALDKILVECLKDQGLEVTFVVRGGPITGDATIEDAKQVGLDKIARVITTGLCELGVDFKRASTEFKESCLKSDLILAKGQSNFETLISQRDIIRMIGKPLFFVFKVKCPVIANYLNVKVGDNIIKLLK